MEGWQSGLTRRTRNAVGEKSPHRFESCTLRRSVHPFEGQFPYIFQCFQKLRLRDEKSQGARIRTFSSLNNAALKSIRVSSEDIQKPRSR